MRAVRCSDRRRGGGGGSGASFLGGVLARGMGLQGGVLPGWGLCFPGGGVPPVGVLPGGMLLGDVLLEWCLD